MSSKLFEYLDLGQECIYEMDMQGNFLRFWAPDDKCLLWPRQEILNNNIASLVEAEIAEKIKKCIKMALSANMAQSFEGPLFSHLVRNYRFYVRPFGKNVVVNFVDLEAEERKHKEVVYGEQVRDFHNFLHRMAESFYRGHLTLEEVTQYLLGTFSKNFDISRVSCWVTGKDQKGKLIECSDLFELSTDKHSKGVKLYQADFPKYFKYLDSNCVLNASDARTNKFTSEFTEVYLKPLNIFSMMDAPIHLLGEVHGVICCEQVGTYRHWLPHEEQAMLSLCNQLSSFINFTHIQESGRAA